MARVFNEYGTLRQVIMGTSEDEMLPELQKFKQKLKKNNVEVIRTHHVNRVFTRDPMMVIGEKVVTTQL